jgi:SAM-dependent methyltransferase
MTINYLDSNQQYWEKGYSAYNVDHPVFRFYGRVLKHDFPQFSGKRLVDFGCGQGAAVNFFHLNGYNAIGVDISKTDIQAAKARYPYIAERFVECDRDPIRNEFYGFQENVAILTAVQSLYYFSDSDFEICIDKLHGSMQTGGVIFATMMAERSAEFFNNSQDVGGGLRRVEFRNDRLCVKDYYMSFIRDEDHLKRKFSKFKSIHVGYYAAKFRNDEGDAFHYTFCGIKV